MADCSDIPLRRSGFMVVGRWSLVVGRWSLVVGRACFSIKTVLMHSMGND